jgi:hypothetical protein
MYLTFRLPSRNSPSYISAFDCSRNCLDISKHPEVSEKAATSRPELLDVIQYLPELEVAVCTTYRVAVCFDEVDHHLYSRYGGCHFSIRRAIAQQLQSFNMSQTLDELRPRPGGVPPLEFLVTPLQGLFFCLLCPSYKTTYYPSLRKHVNKQHGARCGSAYTSSTQSCFLQRWTNRRSKDPGYWTVDATAVPELGIVSSIVADATELATIATLTAALSAVISELPSQFAAVSSVIGDATSAVAAITSETSAVAAISSVVADLNSLASALPTSDTLAVSSLLASLTSAAPIPDATSLEAGVSSLLANINAVATSVMPQEASVISSIAAIAESAFASDISSVLNIGSSLTSDILALSTAIPSNLGFGAVPSCTGGVTVTSVVTATVTVFALQTELLDSLGT